MKIKLSPNVALALFALGMTLYKNGARYRFINGELHKQVVVKNALSMRSFKWTKLLTYTFKDFYK